jgi:hypothetical protein
MKEIVTMKTFLFYLVALLSLITIHPIEQVKAASSEPSQETLVQAWEEIQKKDPNTEVFEKISDRKYKFKSKSFPFNGELQVLNVNIEKYGYGGEDDYGFANSIAGIIEYDLIGLSEEVEKKYSHSLSKWQSNNRLMFDKESSQWLSSKEYFEKISQRMPKEPEEILKKDETKSKLLRLWIPIIVALILMGFIFLARRQGGKSQKEYMERSVIYMHRVEEHLARLTKEVEAIKNQLKKPDEFND